MGPSTTVLLTYWRGHVQHLVGRCCEQGPGTLFRHAGRVRHRERSLKERREHHPLAYSAVSAGGSHAGPGRRLRRACQHPFPGPSSPGACLPWTPGLMLHHLTALASFFSDSLLHGNRWGRKTLGLTASVTPHDAPRPSMRHSEHPCSSPL